MTCINPSSGVARHLLPQGEKEENMRKPALQGEKEENMRKPAPQGEKVGDETQPSPLAGEGDLQAERRKSGEGSTTAHHSHIPAEKRQFARRLRKEMTDAEKKLWQELRARRFEKFKFRRQYPIGPYIADFVCLSHRLIVEVDGSQHDASEHDRKRDAFLAAQGFRVLRCGTLAC